MNQRIYLSLTMAKYFLKWNQERLEKKKKKIKGPSWAWKSGNEEALHVRLVENLKIGSDFTNKFNSLQSWVFVSQLSH